MNERLLTVAQAADVLSLNIQTVRRWLRDGKLRGVQIGEAKTGRNEWRIPESAIGETLKPKVSATRLTPIVLASPDADPEEVARLVAELHARQGA